MNVFQTTERKKKAIKTIKCRNKQ